MMTIIRTIWYLFGLLIVVVLLLSAITVVPGAEGKRDLACLAGLASAGLLAFAGRKMMLRLKRNPLDAFLTSKAWSRTFVALAALLTLAMLSMIA